MAYKNNLSYGLQSTFYNWYRTNLNGWVQVLILQAMNALLDKRFGPRFGHTRLFSMCTATADGLWILCQFINKHLIVQMLMYMCKLCVKSHSSEFSIVWMWISKLEKFLLKLKTDHSEKFAPREINSLYSRIELQRWCSVLQKGSKWEPAIIVSYSKHDTQIITFKQTLCAEANIV